MRPRNVVASAPGNTGLDVVLAVGLAIGLVAGIASCDGDPAPADASGEATTIPIDAAVCVNPGDCPCFSNHDCPATHACVSQDASGTMVSCLEGPRGTGAPGAPCTGEQDCASALCVEGQADALRCSDVCAVSSTCPPELPRCVLFGGTGVCARAL